MPPIRLRQQAALGDADQRVMGFVVIGGGEKRLVGGNKRNASRIGEIDEGGLARALLGEAMTLQLDVEPVAEQALQRLAACRRKLDLAARQKIESQRRTITEGTQEWDILYRKYYNEEVKKLGI